MCKERECSWVCGLVYIRNKLRLSTSLLILRQTKPSTKIYDTQTTVYDSNHFDK